MQERWKGSTGPRKLLQNPSEIAKTKAQYFYISIKSLSDVSEGAHPGVTGEGRVKQINLRKGRAPLTSAFIRVAKGNTLSHNYY